MRAQIFQDIWLNKRRIGMFTAFFLGAVAVGAAGMYAVMSVRWTESDASEQQAESHEGDDGGHAEHAEEEDATDITLSLDKWKAAGVRIESVSQGPLEGSEWLTGKVTLNEDRLAHIFSLVDGQIHEVKVKFGDDVQHGQILAVIDSKEVGEAKLDLSKARLNATFAEVNNEWMQEINSNTQALIETLAVEPPLDSIEERFADKRLGENRGTLISAYANLYKSRQDYQRLGPLAEEGVAAGKRAIEARAELDADEATFQALLERLKFTASQQALQAEQQLEKAKQAVATAQSRLFILGYKQADLSDIDPIAEGEAIAHFEIRAPFNGTVIGKNVVLEERVGPDTEMFQVADLSTLWVQADIYQKHLPSLQQLGENLRFRAPDSEHMHEAEIFYAGDILDPETRTIRLRALVDNPDRHLKAGMFVEVQLPKASVSHVLRVPKTAVVQEEGVSYVFLHKGENRFQKQEVQVGETAGDFMEIASGLSPNDRIAVGGIFALKTAAQGEVESSHSH